MEETDFIHSFENSGSYRKCFYIRFSIDKKSVVPRRVTKDRSLTYSRRLRSVLCSCRNSSFSLFAIYSYSWTLSFISLLLQRLLRAVFPLPFPPRFPPPPPFPVDFFLFVNFRSMQFTPFLQLCSCS